MRYPTLTEMGINNPGEIERFSLNTINNTDILRIVYKRKKGSLLPASKRFRFGRASRSVIADSGTRKTEIIHEISPFVQKAVAELEQLLAAKKKGKVQASLVKEELKRLHEEVASRTKYIESLLDEM
ncbi:MAG: DUF3461 family protein [Gammaproteobacteria bacterium]|nr:DUF3461 family protein [Gammaproteobacteria bacterium]CAJ2375727.1 MAG: conserved hypothetical protein [Arenicellales bacterium IbO2]MDA7969085.1 DUF3461 family protein [Gammaproteobacteria bacterium]MDA7969531.1 DUF3461 family protein [Gammaproteobacteria bacterium]MDA7972420.1 DUF3461 family protein [Gammaproteobacteria bacterium]